MTTTRIGKEREGNRLHLITMAPRIEDDLLDADPVAQCSRRPATILATTMSATPAGLLAMVDCERCRHIIRTDRY